MEPKGRAAEGENGQADEAEKDVAKKAIAVARVTRTVFDECDRVFSGRVGEEGQAREEDQRHTAHHSLFG